MKKYKLTDITFTTKDGSVTFHRILALVDIPKHHVKAGDFGGWIESERNLSQEGSCWVGDSACIHDNAWVYGNALVCGNAQIYGHAYVYDEARVFGFAVVCGDAWIYEHAQVYGFAFVDGASDIYGCASIGCGKFHDYSCRL
ncbi:hypothetical protein IKG29_01995 [Candidatus Saccharibacteria bacterium]|nr:hypothetical protein [Candidatus Saccharibacteria bacterium]